jgi:hypothetical protein
MAPMSPDCHMLHDARMSANMRERKTFNYHFGFEWDFWQREKKGLFQPCPKRGFVE